MTAPSLAPDPQPAAHILVVDDDERIRSLLRRFLMRNDFLVTTARDAAHARRLLDGLDFDLIVLDVMMPGEDGFSLTRDLRKRMTTPILLLTAKGETGDRIEGFESGADDYLPKPFEPRELLLRIAAILRRIPAAEAKGPKFLSLGHLRYDADKGELWQGDAPLRLTGTEQALLRRLADTPRQPVSRSALIEDLGRSPAEEAGENSERAIDVQITRLRRKIEPDPKEPRYLQTVRGTGYMLVPD
ncbi:response regulator [Paracoccus versutus]|uniref:Two-component system phosphate regulon response regulator OmpR n=1 Tax=Paracoccus versutus TaxID=34007 RepID=A0A3E0CFS7_PARVE|nr:MULTISPECIES: response regulator [Paracoccus]MCJ1900805.1 response regulator [Paracoccus versutus]MDF3906062.1 response regulator [Paracoccus sp. AS002]REF67644.1 two-component system phosphate regulon response regulator OmpR [Paracoccus versutus]REG57376.1 two-component system phosphate regulon response regulator OmpR [Paracoccus versutus]WEJ78209.1 response regulator [Paracoccus versutus]